MQKIYLVRHGNTKLNGEDKIRGFIDVPLDDTGLDQADIVGNQLKDKNIEHIITSDMTRAKQTAQAISRITGAQIKDVTGELRPWHLGVMTGQSVKDTLPVIEDYARNNPSVNIPTGESFNNFKNRFLNGVKRIQSRFPDGNICLVTHHRGDRIVAGWEKQGCNNDNEIDLNSFLQKGIPPGGYREIDI